jgi:hypothetical protein
MDDTTVYKIPIFGVQALSPFAAAAPLCLLLLEASLLVVLEGGSWYLAVFFLLLLHGGTASHHLKKIIKAVAVVLLPGTVVEKPMTPVVEIPDRETVGWINNVIERVWSRCLKPLVKPGLANEQLKLLAKLLDDENPTVAALVRQTRVERLMLGGSPVIITRIEADDATPDLLALELGLSYSGTAEAVLRWPRAEVYCVGRGLVLEAECRAEAGPVSQDLSLPASLRLSLLSQPTFQLEGGGLLGVPLQLAHTIATWLLRPAVAWLALRPRAALLQLPGPGLAHWPELREPAGLLRVLVMEGRQLVGKDKSLLQFLGGVFCRAGAGSAATSDPYCHLRLGRSWSVTPVRKATCAPAWNYYCSFPVAAPGPWAHGAPELHLTVMDWDRGMDPDEELGETSVDLTSLDRGGEAEEAWLDLATVRAASGQVRVRLQWVGCLRAGGERREEREAWRREREEGCSGAIVALHLRTVETSAMVEPMVALQVTGGDWMTTTKANFGCSAIFEEQLLLPVTDPDNDYLRLALYDLSDVRLSPRQLLLQGLSSVAVPLPSPARSAPTRGARWSPGWWRTRASWGRGARTAGGGRPARSRRPATRWWGSSACRCAAWPTAARWR